MEADRRLGDPGEAMTSSPISSICDPAAARGQIVPTIDRRFAEPRDQDRDRDRQRAAPHAMMRMIVREDIAFFNSIAAAERWLLTPSGSAGSGQSLNAADDRGQE